MAGTLPLPFFHGFDPSLGLCNHEIDKILIGRSIAAPHGAPLGGPLVGHTTVSGRISDRASYCSAVPRVDNAINCVEARPKQIEHGIAGAHEVMFTVRLYYLPA
jgi:hypothetical protein